MSNLTIASRSREKVLGYPVDIVDSGLAMQIVEEAWRLQKSLHIVTVNAEMIIAAQQNQRLDRIIRHAHLIIPDGSGVVWALRLAGHKIDRLPGIELAAETLAHAAAANKRVALIGSKPETLEKTVSELKKLHPSLNFVATQHGFFTEDEEEEIVARLMEAAPDLILVATGVPKQEYFIDRWMPTFSKSVLIGVGGSFDVWAGAVKRAPAAFRKAHLEWFYRLMAEPWRYKRMGQALPQFAMQVMNELAKKKLGGGGEHVDKRSTHSKTNKHDKKKQRSKDI